MISWRLITGGLRTAPSPFASLLLLAISVNLLAFVLSTQIPVGAAEQNPWVRPGSPISLAISEGLVVGGSLGLRILIRDRTEGMIVQGAVVALLTGDSVNDILITVMGNQFLAVVTSYALTAAIPALVAIKSMSAPKKLRTPIEVIARADPCLTSSA